MLDKNSEEIQWFKEARFGLFIHWGVYAATEGYWKGKETPGIGEWIAAKEKIPMADYEKLAEKMTCEKFNPQKIALLAKNAGMKYCVFTAKHHDGFAMYDTSYDDYSIVKRSPYGKDTAREITEAMRSEGIVPCFYYSQALDFHDENAMGNVWDYTVPESERDFEKYINSKCKYQLKELLTNYGEIGLVWMDVPSRMNDVITNDLKAYVKSIQPDCLLSGRIGETAGMGDFGSFGDNQIPASKPDGCWETASTMNGTWGYKRDDKNFKSPKEIIELLCGLMAKGTNLLLNIGPKANGEIPEESIYILEELAKWYTVNGEAISGTEASPFDCDFSFGGASQKGDAVYLYVYDKVNEINIYGIENEIKGVSVLGGNPLDFSVENGLNIKLDNVEFNEYVTVVKLELDGTPRITKGCQQEKDTLILSAGACKVVKTDTEKIISSNDEDAAVDAEKFNLAAEKEMAVNVAGIVENWYSDKNHIEWSFDVTDEGEYELCLYSVTQKYKSWQGGHKLTAVCNGNKLKTVTLTADRESAGANKKYFSETGSIIGRAVLKKGGNNVCLNADYINSDDPVGLSVSKIMMKKI